MSAPKYWRFGDAITPLMEALDQGGILAIPTESSYGLAVDPRSRAGVGAIYKLKKRQAGKPLPLVIANLEQAAQLGVPLDFAGLLEVGPHWPAPLTLVVPTVEDLAAAAGGKTVAVRIPAHKRLCTLLEALGTGLTATSANESGQEPLLAPASVARMLTGLGAPASIVIDDGRLQGGPPSTVVEWNPRRGLQVLRQGRYPIDRLVPPRGPGEERGFSTTTVEIATENSS